MNCIHLRNRIKESEKERDMPLYRIGQAWIPSLVIRVSFCLLIVVQPSLAINSSTRPTIIKPVKRRQILVRHPSPPPTRFFSHAEDNSREYIYIYILTLNRSWRVFVEKLLEPVAAGRASFRSIAYALYKPTKRFYLFFLSPPSRASFVSTNRQRSPLFIYTAAADVSLLLLICPVYTRIIHVYVSPVRLVHAHSGRPFDAIGDNTRSFRPPLVHALHPHGYFAREFIAENVLVARLVNTWTVGGSSVLRCVDNVVMWE